MIASVRRAVQRRSRSRCEYCHRPESASSQPFQIDHCVAQKHGGSDELSNLAFACPPCNYAKGYDLAGIDPETGRVVRLYNPRKDRWPIHFSWDGPTIIGRTATGRATIATLQLNKKIMVEIREGLMAAGLFFDAAPDS